MSSPKGEEGAEGFPHHAYGNSSFLGDSQPNFTELFSIQSVSIQTVEPTPPPIPEVPPDSSPQDPCDTAYKYKIKQDLNTE